MLTAVMFIGANIECAGQQAEFLGNSRYRMVLLEASVSIQNEAVVFGMIDDSASRECLIFVLGDYSYD